MITSRRLEEAARALQQGGVIAYPTEAVFGLGCDPLNEAAVMRILEIKRRAVEKGVILIAADRRQLMPYIGLLDDEMNAKLDEVWPGPVTCVVPAGDRAPDWITGGRPGIAVRVTAHPVAAALCRQARMPIVSTSANRAGEPPLRTASAVAQSLGADLDHVVDAPVGELDQPTTILDISSGQTLR